MFKEKHLKNIQKLMNFKNLSSAEIFLKRLSGWINANSSSPLSLAKGIYKIATDLHLEEIEQAKKIKKINLSATKNPLLKKYATEILHLRDEGLGSKAISKYLFEKHRAKISHMTIYRFLKQQEELIDG